MKTRSLTKNTWFIFKYKAVSLICDAFFILNLNTYSFIPFYGKDNFLSLLHLSYVELLFFSALKKYKYLYQELKTTYSLLRNRKYLVP